MQHWIYRHISKKIFMLQAMNPYLQRAVAIISRLKTMCFGTLRNTYFVLVIRTVAVIKNGELQCVYLILDGVVDVPIFNDLGWPK